jgi:hypothetical protein
MNSKMAFFLHRLTEHSTSSPLKPPVSFVFTKLSLHPVTNLDQLSSVLASHSSLLINLLHLNIEQHHECLT